MPVEIGLNIESYPCLSCDGWSDFVFIGHCYREWSWWHNLLVWLHIRESRIEIGEGYMCLRCRTYKFVPESPDVG